MDKNTFSYYKNHATEYAEKAYSLDTIHLINNFIKNIPENGYILDAGCGPGRDMSTFKSLGFNVTGIDLSQNLVKIAQENVNAPIFCQDILKIEWKNQFDGIWCMSSLLHFDEKQLEKALLILKDALKENGVIYASFKEGNSFSHDEKKRFFNNKTENQVHKLFKKLNFNNIKTYLSNDLKNRKDVNWVNVIAFK